MDPFTPLFDVLREGREHLKIALECRLESGNVREKDAEQQSQASSSTADTQDARILAVVSNVEKGHEESCLLLLKRRKKDAKRAKVVDGLPILPRLKVIVDTVQSESNAETQRAQHRITVALAGRQVTVVSNDEQAVDDLVKVVEEAAASALQLPTNTDADEDARSQSKAVTAATAPQVQHPDVADGPTHMWMSHYLDGRHIAAAAASTPIFSRFTTSSINPPKSSRSPAPSPSAGEVKVSFGTWNVNGLVPTSDASLDQWLHIVDDDPDILIVGLEEADSSGLSYVMWTPHVEEAWSQAIESAMGRNVNEYEKLASRQLVGVLMLVYVKKSLRPDIAKLSHAAVGVGFGGWAANKGATALRFELEGTSFCFVVSHLSAFEGQEALERRRWDFHEILRRLKLPLLPSHHFLGDVMVDSDGSLTSASDSTFSSSDEEDSHDKGKGRDGAKRQWKNGHLRRRLRKKMSDRLHGSTLESSSDASRIEAKAAHQAGATDAESMLRSQLRQDSMASIDTQASVHAFHILDHDVVFWGGDLNFRIDLSTTETKRLIPRQQYEETLLKFDQLRKELKTNTSFEGFQEQHITFAPTYKFDRGTDTYDTSEKQRCPSWTDRILWREKALVEKGHSRPNVPPAAEQTSSVAREKRVTPLSYESCPELRISDHKPVLAAFMVNVGKAPFSKP